MKNFHFQTSRYKGNFLFEHRYNEIPGHANMIIEIKTFNNCGWQSVISVKWDEGNGEYSFNTADYKRTIMYGEMADSEILDRHLHLCFSIQQIVGTIIFYYKEQVAA